MVLYSAPPSLCRQLSLCRSFINFWLLREPARPILEHATLLDRNVGVLGSSRDNIEILLANISFRLVFVSFRWAKWPDRVTSPVLLGRWLTIIIGTFIV